MTFNAVGDRFFLLPDDAQRRHPSLIVDELEAPIILPQSPSKEPGISGTGVITLTIFSLLAFKYIATEIGDNQ